PVSVSTAELFVQIDAGTEEIVPAVGVPEHILGLVPLNSSAPISGAKPLGRASPSISVVTPTVAPPDSSRVLVAAGM
ncbi:MAG TPA: hypothetical protein PK198_19440, partial [Saprospiraceae bacterium]|nr:hypothetical protein [Saprospiraceae bacterium]